MFSSQLGKVLVSGESGASVLPHVDKPRNNGLVRVRPKSAREPEQEKRNVKSQPVLEVNGFLNNQ